MSYKVIKEFGCAKKGDILNRDVEDAEMYTLEVETGNSYRYASLDEDSVKQYCERGFLIEVSNVEDTIEETVELIDSMLEQYCTDYENTMIKAKEGKIQPCVKVEAETVYYNIARVLNKIKSTLINE